MRSLTVALATFAVVATPASAAGWTSSKVDTTGFGNLTTTFDGHVYGQGDFEGGADVYPINADGTRGEAVAGLSSEGGNRIAAFGPSGLVGAHLSCNPKSANDIGVTTVSAPSAKPAFEILPGTTCKYPLAAKGNRRGDIAVMTNTDAIKRHGKTSYSRSVWLRHAGAKRFARVLRIKVRYNATDGVVALGPKGDLLVAWKDGVPRENKPSTTYARYRDAHGRWLATETLGKSSDLPGDSLNAAVQPNGTRLILWNPQYRATVLARASGGHRFAGHATGVGLNDPQLAVAPESNAAIVAGFNADGGARRLQIANVRGGRIGGYQDVVLPAGAGWPTITGASVANSGAAIVTTSVFLPPATHENQQAGIVATRPATGQPFTAAQVLTTDGGASDALATPDGSRFFLTYSTRNDGYYDTFVATASP